MHVYHTSHNSIHSTENMREVKVRSSFTSSGSLALAPYEKNNTYYEISNINLGNNSISRLEVVSSLNSFNLAYLQYHYNFGNCPKNYNPKVYFGTIQTVANSWYYDVQTGQTNGLGDLPDTTSKKWQF